MKGLVGGYWAFHRIDLENVSSSTGRFVVYADMNIDLGGKHDGCSRRVT